ncbi:zinc ribbon domain-containing protein [Pleurocapsa sp. PCC 7327]|uniref:zinc ribbon domain-containing protein n=1 Tax=Pleurocapsa sp. PCC 7327 TaxID=118163 RepID=UPI001184C3F5
MDAASRKGEKFVCTNCGHVDDANWQAARNIKAKAVNQYRLLLKTTTKVRQDLPKPRQLILIMIKR